jgi:hypothetical protein
MKATLLALALAAGVCFAGSLPGPAPETRLPARFSLYSASIPVVSEGTATQCRNLFKYDKVTGRTWIFVYICGSETNQPIIGWLEVTNVGTVGFPLVK